MLGVKKDATPAEVKKTYFAVCLEMIFSTCFIADDSDSLLGNTTLTPIPTRMLRQSSWRYRRPTTCGYRPTLHKFRALTLRPF